MPTNSQSDIVQMINDAYVYIYIVAKSDSKTFDKKVLKALQEAHKNNMFIHVALHHSEGELPKIWKEIQPLVTTFNTQVPANKLTQEDEVVIADRVMLRTQINNNGEKEVLKEGPEQINDIAQKFFSVPDCSLSAAMKQYEKVKEDFLKTDEGFYFCLSNRVPSYQDFAYRQFRQKCQNLQTRIDTFVKANKEAQERAIDLGPVLKGLAIAGVISIAGIGVLKGCNNQTQPNAPVSVSKNVITTPKDTQRQNGGN